MGALGYVPGGRRAASRGLHGGGVALERAHVALGERCFGVFRICAVHCCGLRVMGCYPDVGSMLHLLVRKLFEVLLV